jgi:glycosyltransferase involved in cell wall biosynthesis
MKPLRVAFLSPDCVATQNNGTTTYLTRIARAVLFAGHQPEIFSISHLDAASYDFYGIPVHSVHAVEHHLLGRLQAKADRLSNDGFSTMLRSLAGAWALARRQRFDLVHGIDEGLTGLFVRRRQLRLMVFCQYDRQLWRQTEGEQFSLGDRLLAQLIRAGVRRADVAYAHSRFLSEHLRSRYGLRTHIFRPPIFAERVPVRRTGLGEPERYLVHFGLLGRRKGTDLVAEALPLAWREAPDLRMVWAGPMREDPEAAMARYRQKWGGFSDAVRWVGRLGKPALYRLVQAAVASVLPSRADNLPNTVSESLVLKVPVIAFDGASLNEMIEPGVSGELVPDGDVPALAAAMVRAWHGATRWVRPPAMMAETEPAVAATNFVKLAGLGHHTTPLMYRPPALDGLRIRAVHPPTVRAGQGFNLQPNGASVFAIECEHAGPWTMVTFDGEPLETTFGNRSLVTALAPPHLVDRPGIHQVQLSDELLGISNVIEFIVES